MNENVQKLMSADFTIATLNTSGNKQREDSNSRKGLHEISQVLRIWAKAFRFLKREKPDFVNIFVTSNLAFSRDSLFILMAKLLKKKVVVHLHSKKRGEVFLGKFSIWVLAFFINMADKVYVLSDDHKIFFSKYFKEEIVDVLENFVFVEQFLPIRERKTLELMYIGRLTDLKGFFDLLTAIKRLSKDGYGFVVHIAGVAGNDEEERRIRHYVKINNLDRHINFAGLVSGPRKLEIFHRSAVLVFPSRFENSPIVLIEALAAKQIIVCSDIEANKIVLSNFSGYGETVFPFKVSSVDDLTEKMKFLLDSSHEILTRTENVSCREQVTDQYALRKLKKDFYELALN